MPRVCLVGLIAGGHSGIPRYSAALTRALDEVAPEFPDVSLRLLTTERGARESAVRRMPVAVVGRPFASANAGLRRIVGEQVHAARADADLLHFFDLSGPLLAARRPFTATVHDAALRHGFEGTRFAHKQVIQPWAIRHATAAVAVSAFAREEAVARFGADPARVRVVHSGPGLTRPAPGHARSDPDAAAPRRGAYLLYVGNLAVHKNLPFLVRAFAAAAVDARLVLVGRRGDRFAEVQTAIDSSGARVEIRRDASDAEVEDLYRGARALVLPSRYEGFGFTALEAMARGCPVLASDIPALREVSGDGALLLPLDDEAAWVEAMRRVTADGRLRSDLRRRGEATVARYSWEATARGVCRLFLDVAGRR